MPEVFGPTLNTNAPSGRSSPTESWHMTRSAQSTPIKITAVSPRLVTRVCSVNFLGPSEGSVITRYSRAESSPPIAPGARPEGTAFGGKRAIDRRRGDEQSRNFRDPTCDRGSRGRAPRIHRPDGSGVSPRNVRPEPGTIDTAAGARDGLRDAAADNPRSSREKKRRDAFDRMRPASEEARSQFLNRLMTSAFTSQCLSRRYKALEGTR